MNLLKNAMLDWVNAAVAAGSSIDDNTAIKDMDGYDGILIMVPITDSAATGVAALTIEGNSANSDTGMTAITGAVATATCTVNDDLNNQLLIVDVYRPQTRYVQGVLTSATANIAFGEAVAIRYKGRKMPVTQDTTTVAASTSVVGS